jgi:hypothetical protein
MAERQEWEYLTIFLEADADANREYVERHQGARRSRQPAGPSAVEVAKFAPEALIPDLNRLGADGWELVHMEPVAVGKNDDVMIHYGGGLKTWCAT